MLNVYIMDLSEEDRNSLITYEDLTTYDKIQAIDNAITIELKSIQEHIQYKKNEVLTNLHKGINNKNSFERVKNALKIKSKLFNPVWVERFIISNFVQFTKDGNQVYYCPPEFKYNYK